MQAAIRAYERREQAEYWRAALIASTIYNRLRDPNARALRIQDFMPQVHGRSKKKTPEEQLALLRAMTMAMGGEVRG